MPSKIMPKRTAKHAPNLHSQNISTEAHTMADIEKSFVKQTDLMAAVRKIPDHNCQLSVTESATAVSGWIESGICVTLRRRLRRFTMIDPHHPQSKVLLKSAARIRAHEMYHLRRYPQMIHPFSQFRFVWDLLWIFTYIALLIVMPLEMVLLRQPVSLVFFKFTLDIISYLDIAVNFRTGYRDTESHVIMEPRQVVRQYLCGHFVFDFLSSLPINFLMWITGESGLAPLKYIFLLKLIRFKTLLERTTLLLKRYNLDHPYVTPVRMFFCLLVGIHWATCVSLLTHIRTNNYKAYIRLKQKTSEALLYTAHMSIDTVRKFMLIGIRGDDTQSMGELMMQMICIVIGAFINSLLLAIILRVYERRMSSESSYDELVNELNHFVRYKGLSHRLRDRLFQFVKFKYQKHIVKENEILLTLSGTLQREILYHNCSRLVKRVALFSGFPTELMMALSTKLKLVIYLAGDVVIQAGVNPAHCMYIIYLGKLAVFTPNGEEICHLAEGNYFGEIALISNTPRVATVVAIKECQLFRLNRRDFAEAMEAYPLLREKLERYAKERMEDTLSRIESSMSSM